MTKGGVTTARALSMFRAELAAYGFPAELVDDLTRIVCEAEVRATGGLAVTDEPPGSE